MEKNWGKKNQKGPKILPCAWFFVKTFSDRFDIIISSPYSRKARESRQIFLMHRNQLLPIFRVFSSIHFLDCHSQIKWWAYPSCFHQVWNVKETSNLFINNLEIWIFGAISNCWIDIFALKQCITIFLTSNFSNQTNYGQVNWYCWNVFQGIHAMQYLSALSILASYF